MLKFTALPTPLTPDTSHPALIKPVTQPSSFPCRRCLQDGRPGEEMLLLPYNPFTPTPSSTSTSPSPSPYTGPGPIYVHRSECAHYQCDGSVPEQQRKRLVAVRAYDVENMMVGFAVVKGEELGVKAGELLEDEEVKFLHVYYAGPGCFAVRIDRGGE